MSRFLPFLLMCAFCQTAFAGLSVTPQSVDVGRFSAAETKTVTFTARNTGQGTVKILRVFPSCPCVRIDGFPASLAPGEAGRITAVLKPYESDGAFTRTLLIATDAAAASAEIKGEAVPLFTVRCDTPVILTAAQPDTVWTGRYTVVASAPGFRLGNWRSQEYGGCVGTLAIRTNATETASYEVVRRVKLSASPAQSSTAFIGILSAAHPDVPPLTLTFDALLKK